jgi:integrase
LGLAIRNITKHNCEQWLTGRGSKIAPQTFAHELDTMRMVFNYAVDRGLILMNPAAHIKRRRIGLTQIQIPTREQFLTLVAAIRQSDGRSDSQAKAKPGADLVELLAYSGMRLREATSLRWGDVDFDRGVITVTGGETGTKNHEHRIVPMTDALRGLLLRLRSERPEQAGKRDWVISINNAKTTLRKTCKRLGFPRFTHHDFRHFFATTCIESGVDVPTVSRWLGHKDGGALAMRVYGHLREEHSRAQIKRVTFAPTNNIIEMPESSEVSS